MGAALDKAQLPKVNRVVTFRLGGTGKLPVLPAEQSMPFDPPAVTASDAVIARGRTLFHTRCWMCHGDTGVNKGGVPDLRMSAMIGDKAAFAGFVLQGAAEPRGMPNFGKDLSPEETEAIRAYVIKRANDLKAERGKR
jgi:quinohemoprotein ethanol dehydrogenase